MCVTWTEHPELLFATRARACECPRGTWNRQTLEYVSSAMRDWSFRDRRIQTWLARSHATSANGFYPPGHTFRVEVYANGEHGNSTSPRLDLAIAQALRILEVRIGE